MPSLSSPDPVERWRSWRFWLAAAVLAYGSYAFVVMTKKFLPLEGWTLWRFSIIWPATLVWWASLMVSGRAILTRVVRVSLPGAEQATMSFTLGLMAFHTLFSLFGFVGLLNRVTYFLTPVLLAAPGIKASLLDVRRRLRHRLPPRRLSPLRIALTSFGVVGVALIYFPIIAPSHLGFDSGWYHIPLAEHYVAAGGIVRFPEGWYLGPHLASIIYTWGLMTPGLSFADRLVLLNHLEFVTFVMTLVGVAALAIRVGRNNKLGLAWVAMFAFPTLYLHDLQIAADHVAAFFFAPVYLGLYRAWKYLNPRFVALFAAGAAGGLATKYTAAHGMLVPIVAILGRAAWLALRRKQWRRVGLGLGTAAGVGLTLTAPFWLKQWVYYGNPLYPMLQNVFHGRPWHEDATLVYQSFLKVAVTGAAPGWKGVKESAEAMLTFSGTACEFWEYHRNVPYFGGLFTIASLSVPFLPVGKRIWVLLLGLHGAIFVWFWQAHQDRYLQAIVPGMAALIGVVAFAAWEKWATRVAFAATVIVQLAWGSSVFGLPAQVAKYKAALATLSSTYDGTWDKPVPELEPWVSVGKKLPHRAVVLVHDTYWHTGLERRTVNDWIGLQAGLNYGRMASSRELLATLRRMGVTHLLWHGSPMSDDSLASDLRFYELAETESVDKHTVGWISVAKLPKEVPAPSAEEWVLVQGCKDTYQPGLYRFASTAVQTMRGQSRAPIPAPAVPLTDENAEELAGRAKFALTRSGCNRVAESAIQKAFKSIGPRAGATLWIRKDAH